MKTRLEIELLYFEGCPSWQRAFESLEAALAEYAASPEVALVKVDTPEAAVQHRFVGSPTIRINGKDLFPVDQDHFALGCRIYATEDRFRAEPTEKMLKEKLSVRLAARQLSN